MATTWRYIAHGALDADVILTETDPDDDAPFAGISAQRNRVDDAVEVALVGQPDGSVRVVITGAEAIDVEVVDDRASTGGAGAIRLA
jgi:hypothetical protein